MENGKNFTVKNVFTTRALTLLFDLLLFCTIQASSAGEERIYRSYYALLDSLQAVSLDQRFDTLQRFLLNHPSFEEVYLTLLDWYVYNGQIDKAQGYFQQLSAEPEYRQHAFWMIAKAYQLKGDSSSAFKAYVQALKTGPPSLLLLKEFINLDNDQVGKFNGEAIIQKLSLAQEIREIASAFYYYFRQKDEKAIEIFSKSPDKITHHPVVLDIWGYCYFYSSRPIKADSIWRLGYRIASQQGNLRAKTRFLSNLGLLAKQVAKDYHLALAYYDSAYVIAARINDYYRLQILSGYRGFLYRDQGNYQEAVKYFEEAINICSKLQNYRFLWDWYRGYAMTLYYLGRYTSALATIDSSEALARRSKNTELLVRTLLDKAELYITLKQLLLAKATLKEVLNITVINKLRNHQESARAKLGQVLMLEGNYVEARELFEEYIDILSKNPAYRKDVYLWIGRVANIYLVEKKYEQARVEFQKAFKAAQEAEATAFEGWYLLHIGDAELHLGNIDTAFTKYEAALKIASEEGITEMLWEIYEGYGNAYKKAGKLEAAISAYRQAVKIIEDTRSELNVDQLRIGYFVDGYAVYESLVYCYLQRYWKQDNPSDLDSVFYYHEMGRSRALQDLLSNRGVTHYTHEYLQARNRLRLLQRSIRLKLDQFRPAREIESLKNELELVRLSMLAQQLNSLPDKHSPEITKPPAFSNLSTILKNLEKSHLGLLLYHISEEVSFVLAAAENKVEIVQLNLNPDSLESAIESLMKPFHNAEAGLIQKIPFKAETAFRLYQALIKPVEERFHLPRQLFVVPDLSLTNLPFEMLLTSKPDSAEYTPGDLPTYADWFLLHRYTFTYSPSTSLLLAKEASPVTDNPNVMVVANPFYYKAEDLVLNQTRAQQRYSWRFTPLFFAEWEAEQIKRVHANTDIRKRDQATKSALIKEIPRHQIIHFATHGFVDSTFDSFSGLALALGPDSTDDGLFMGYEILDLPFNCDLVTLSACETGRGKFVVGEGVLALPRLFIGAGAKSVIMTLWKVDDKFASELMPNFYDYLLNQKLTKAEALARAKRNLIGKRNTEGASIYYQHPFYWAPFILYGDPGGSFNSIHNSTLYIILFIIIIIPGSILLFFLIRKRAKTRTVNETERIK
ncbi:MAG: hypothetical protein CV087_16010 [Candidatus Brocadia sp. WS118]|nr:MAG: hypothetical protein CV087_16010 [Candidatus Brocadia sp. WS118]